jgi:predicted aspartyl protease
MALLPTLLVLATMPAQTVEVPFRLGESAIIVDAQVNGANVSCMFDTGFSGTVALNNNVEIGKPTGTMTLRDFVGEFQASTTKIKSLKLGSKVIDPTGMEAVQQPMGRGLSMSYNAHTDGIMGFEVISHNITQINFEKRKFVFYPKSFDINKLVPDNKRTFMCKLLPIGHNAMELEVVAPNGKKLILALDTGNAFYATTHKDALERIGLWKLDLKPKFMKQSGVASGSVDSWSLLLKNMTNFGVPVAESIWDIIDAPSSSAESDGTVGFGFLHNFNITIDYEKRRVFLENWSGKVVDEFVGEVGVGATNLPDVSGVYIYDVAPESPAALAGVKEGDILLSIDGEDLSKQDFRQIDRMIQGKVGSKVKLVTSQKGAVKRYELERKLLVNEVPG